MFSPYQIPVEKQLSFNDYPALITKEKIDKREIDLYEVAKHVEKSMLIQQRPNGDFQLIDKKELLKLWIPMGKNIKLEIFKLLNI